MHEMQFVSLDFVMKVDRFKIINVVSRQDPFWPFASPLLLFAQLADFLSWGPPLKMKGKE